MAEISVQIKDINTKLIKQATEEAVYRALEAVGMQAESYAKGLCPVDTGNLRNSITHEVVDEKTVAIGSPVEYAAYVETGHRTATGGQVAPQPYLEPAVTQHIDQYKTIFETYLKNGE